MRAEGAPNISFTGSIATLYMPRDEDFGLSPVESMGVDKPVIAHPSGAAEPGTADKTLTKRLNDALALVDIRVLDHVVVGGPEAVRRQCPLLSADCFDLRTGRLVLGPEC